MPIITRLDAFLRPKCIRNIVSQRQSRFDLGQVMDSGVMFVGKLSQGAIGEQNAYLLGSLLVAKFQQAALARDRQAEAAAKGLRPAALRGRTYGILLSGSVSTLIAFNSFASSRGCLRKQEECAGRDGLLSSDVVPDRRTVLPTFRGYGECGM